MMAEVLHRSGHVHALVFTGPDGDRRARRRRARALLRGDAVRACANSMIDPRDVGLDVAPLDAVRGGDAETNAAIILSVLDGERRTAA